MASNKEVYDKIEDIVRNRLMVLESENARLRHELAIAEAKLDVYDRIASVSDSQRTIGFGPPIREGGND